MGGAELKQILLLISSVFYYDNGFIHVHIDLKIQQKYGSRFKLFLITLQFQGVTKWHSDVQKRPTGKYKLKQYALKYDVWVCKSSGF